MNSRTLSRSRLFGVTGMFTLIMRYELDAKVKRLDNQWLAVKMGTKTNKLISILGEVATLLRKHGVFHWAEWLENDKALLEKSDFYGIEHLLSAFGGMGSFNDLYICKENGHAIEKEETSSVNDNLLVMNRTIYELAEEIRQEANAQ